MKTKSRMTGVVRSKAAAMLVAATTMAVVSCASGDDGAPEALGTASSELVTPQTTIGDVTVVAPPEAAPGSGTFVGWRAVPGALWRTRRVPANTAIKWRRRGRNPRRELDTERRP